MLDFGEEWRRQAQVRRKPDDAAHWDRRARDEVTKFGPSDYSEEFLDKARLLPGETLFDMGCGAGTLAIPAARRGHGVLACDFSSVMLQRLRAGIPEGLEPLVKTKLLSWDDDWEAAGVLPRSVDVACASRSIITADLQDSLRRLSGVARRRACVTVTAGMSPRVFPALFRDLGLRGQGHQDAAFVFGVLCQDGYEPEVSFIRSERYDRFASFEDAFNAYAGMLDFAVDAPQGGERARFEGELRSWLHAHLAQDEGGAAPEGEIRVWSRQDADDVAQALPYRVDVPREFAWAFISWDVRR
ncbi:MAG: class I SAM-dependent methyltransferase [Eggerthellaceae bacterium]|jgi:SAM-dependent methyltransferase